MNMDQQQTHGPILTEEQLERYIREAHRLRSETIGGGIVRLGIGAARGFKRLIRWATIHERAAGQAKGRAPASGGTQYLADAVPGAGPTREPRAVAGRADHPSRRAA
jgi:hypothetical protein